MWGSVEYKIGLFWQQQRNLSSLLQQLQGQRERGSLLRGCSDSRGRGRPLLVL